MIENAMVLDWWWPEYHTITEEEEDRWAEAHDNEDEDIEEYRILKGDEQYVSKK